MALFNADGIHFLFRWLHVFVGIIWIGHLYYFNFVQGPFFNETDASTKSNAIQKLVPRALWWFRHSALWTFLTGFLMFGMRGHMGGLALFATSYGIMILMAVTLATTMFLNVWLVIWPNQRIVIENATATAQGKPAVPGAADAAARAFVASRTNTLFSIPMLFFMVGAGHVGIAVDPATYKYGVLTTVFLLIFGALEFNALKGKPGVLQTVKGVISSGFVLTAVLYLLAELCK